MTRKQLKSVLGLCILICFVSAKVSAQQSEIMLKTMSAQQQTAQDRDAMEQVYQQLQQQLQDNGKISLEQLAKQFPITGQLTEFDLPVEIDVNQATFQPLSFPEQKLNADISDDEWQALLNSRIIAEPENQIVTLSLVDLDQDGLRDLIVRYYYGGTSLSSNTGVLKRQQDRFVTVKPESDEVLVSGELYSVSLRGANQSDYWLQINGQIYALWSDGEFGKDKLYLLRPFKQTQTTPMIQLHYRYPFAQIPLEPLELSSDSDGESPITWQAEDKAKLIQQLDQLQQTDKPTSQQAHCPIAKAFNQCQTDIPYLQQVGCLTVWINKQCYVGNVVSHHGKDLMLLLSRPSSDAETDETINHALNMWFGDKRHVVKIAAPQMITDKLVGR